MAASSVLSSPLFPAPTASPPASASSVLDTPRSTPPPQTLPCVRVSLALYSCAGGPTRVWGRPEKKGTGGDGRGQRVRGRGWAHYSSATTQSLHSSPYTIIHKHLRINYTHIFNIYIQTRPIVWAVLPTGLINCYYITFLLTSALRACVQFAYVSDHV